MKTDLYHASGRVLEVGITLPSEVRAVADANAWIEEEFERYRGGRSVSRRETLFAAGNDADCVKYLKAQQDYDGRPVYVYRAAMPSPQRHPMALADRLRRNKGNDQRLSEIAKEYWQPTQAWQFWEYLDGSMTVIEKLDLPEFGALAGASQRYLADFDLAARLWPEGPKVGVQSISRKDRG